MKKVTSIQMNYETFSKKHDIKREVHRKENWENTHGVGVVPTSNFENHLRYDVSGAVSLITEPELKTTKRDFKRSSESESRIFIMMETIF